MLRSLSSPILHETAFVEENAAQDEIFNPLGPPHPLVLLSVGDTIGQITRLSQSPDIFLVRDCVPSKYDRDTIMRTADASGMKVAGTRRSGTNTVRQNSFLTWINPYELPKNDTSSCREARSIVRKMTNNARTLFAHSAMNALLDDGEFVYSYAEDVQVAKYDQGGAFSPHHDGFERYLTVLTYMNGVGGTYFPLANTNEVDVSSEQEASAMTEDSAPGRDGLLLVGKEGSEPYTHVSQKIGSAIIEICPGDAVAFYNYKSDGQKDWKSLHASLSVPEEKWIATNWFLSERLTGPFGPLYKDRLANMMKDTSK